MLRYIFLFMVCTTFITGAISQNLNGLVFNEITGNPVTDANVVLQQLGKPVKQATTSQVGRFSLLQITTGNYLLRITHVGYKPYEQRISVNDGAVLEELLISLAPLVVESQEVVVSAFKATAKTPVTQTNLSQKTIEQEYVGADIPTLISGTPSINSYSEAGNGMGYSYFRIRGIDQTRINFTINGVPINDPQNQGFFTNNFADLASSAQQIQIQRGVGTSNNGVAAFGGSVSVTSKNLTENPEFTFHSGYGSYNSYRNTLEYQTGRLANGKVAFYGRLSDLSSDGYRQNSNTKNRTYFVSAGLFGKKSLLKINAWGGVSQSQLSYVGVDKATLENARTTNFLTAAERDEFRQNFYQLQYTYHFNANLNLSASAYYVKGKAPYFDVRFNDWAFAYQNMPDTVFNGTDTATTANFINRYRLDQEFIGGFASLNYATKKLQVNVGIHANRFESDSYMQAVWGSVLPAGIEPEHTVFFNTGVKQEMSAFAKASYTIGEKTTLFADVLARRATWTYTPKAQQYLYTQYNVEPMEWLFINPKVGARYAASKNASFFIMAGMTGREPTRFDYLRDELTYRDIKQDELKPERVTDIELGANINTKTLWLNANVYYMAFENQIANTGYTNQFGAAITQNTGNGYRTGIEIEGQWNITPRLALTHASNISDSRINSFTQFYSVTDTGGNVNTEGTTYSNVRPALTPTIIINQGIKYRPTNYITLTANGRYVGKQYIDNTETESLSLAGYTVVDAALHLNLQQWTGIGEQTLSIRVNNITNTLYSPHGALGAYFSSQTQDAQGNKTVTTPAAFFPAATTNFFITLMMKF